MTSFLRTLSVTGAAATALATTIRSVTRTAQAPPQKSCGDHGWRRSWRRRLVVLGGAGLLGLGGAAAWAYFGASAAAGSAGGAQAATVHAGATPSVSVTAGRQVTVTWGSSALSNGRSVDGYVITRYDASDVPHVPVSTFNGCSGTIDATTCTESSVPAGTWTYTVTPVVGADWRGAESPESGGLTIAPAKVTLDKSLFNGGDFGGGTADEAGAVSGFGANETLAFKLDDPSSGTAVSGSPGSVGAAGTASFSASLPHVAEGAHTFWAVGNATPLRSQASAGIVIDTVPPVTTSSGFDALWHADPVTVALSSADPDPGTGVDTLNYDVDGNPIVNVAGASANVLVPAPSDHSNDGAHVVRYSATDIAGNVEFLHQIGVKIDTTAPATTLATTPAAPDGSNGWFQRSSVSFTLGATDPGSPSGGSGVASTYYTVDGGAAQLYAGSVPVSGQGDHVVTYWSTDSAGNVEATNTSHIKLDDVAPSTTEATSPADPEGNAGWYWRTSVTFTLAAADATSGVATTRYTINGGSPQTYTGAAVTVGTQGDNTVTYWSVDTAGNAEAAHTFHLKLDDFAPDTTLATSPASPDGTNGWFRQTSVSFSLAATDAASGVAVTHYTVDGGLEHDYSAAVTIATPGVHTVEDWSADRAGNTEDAHSTQIKLDAVAPATTIAVAPPSPTGSNGWYSTTPTFTLAASDAVSGVAASYYTLDGGAQQTYGGAVSIPDGQHTIAYWSVDNAGNAESAHTTATIKVDTVKPSTTIALNPASPSGSAGWYSSTPTFTLAASDATSGVGTTFYRIDSGLQQAYTGAVSVADGQHTISYWSVDNAGNVESATTTATIKVDTVKPATTLALSPATVNGLNGWYTTIPTFTLSATDATSGVATTLYTIDGGAQQTYAGSAVSIPEGQHTVAYWSVDAAGNAETAHTTATIKVDPTRPTDALTLGASPSGAFLNGSTLYYKADAPARSFTLVDTVVDTTSGPQFVTFPAIAATGWTHALQNVSTPAGGPFVSSPYTWTSGAAAPTSISGRTILSQDNAGNLSTGTLLTFVNDVTAPTTGALTVNAVAASGAGTTSTSASTGFTLGPRTDYVETLSASQSGLSASVLTVQSTTLSGTICGAAGSGGPFTSATVVSGTTQPAGIANGFCYVYALTGTDHVGNTASIKTTVKVPAAVTVTSASPSSRGAGASGQTITIAGTNFQSGATVAFSGTGITVNSTTFNNAAQLTLNISVSGSAATGARNVTVTNPDTGTATCTGCFTVNAAPTISFPTSSNTQNVPRGGSVTFTVTGANFQSGATVTINGNGYTVNSVTFVDSGHLSVTVQGSNSFSFNDDLTVTNPDGGSATSSNSIRKV